MILQSSPVTWNQIIYKFRVIFFFLETCNQELVFLKQKGKPLAEQDAKFNASLEADCLKEEPNGILSEEQRLNELMKARKGRVPPNPELTTSTEYVAVQHVKVGTKSKLFRSTSHFSVVFDWIGSLSNTPEFYEIKDHKGVTAQPD